MLDRIKDIYEAPERLEDLRSQYEETTAQMASQLQEQQEQLEEARRQADALLARQELLQQSNDSYRQQNEELAAEKEALLAQMEQAEEQRKALYAKAGAVAGGLLAAIVLYALSVRVWRYMVWRRQGRDNSGAIEL